MAELDRYVACVAGRTKFGQEEFENLVDLLQRVDCSKSRKEISKFVSDTALEVICRRYGDTLMEFQDNWALVEDNRRRVIDGMPQKISEFWTEGVQKKENILAATEMFSDLINKAISSARSVPPIRNEVTLRQVNNLNREFCDAGYALLAQKTSSYAINSQLAALRLCYDLLLNELGIDLKHGIDVGQLRTFDGYTKKLEEAKVDAKDILLVALDHRSERRPASDMIPTDTILEAFDAGCARMETTMEIQRAGQSLMRH